MIKTYEGLKPYHTLNSAEYDEGDRSRHFSMHRSFLARNGQSLLTISLALALVWSLFGRGPPPPPERASTPPHPQAGSSSNVNTATFFKDIYAPFVHRDLATPVTYLSDVTNKTKTLSHPGKPVWTTPFGKDVLILDLDTRSFNGSNQMFNDGDVAWDKLDGSSAGVLNHYMYSLIHGYDYKFVRATPPSDRFASWTKPSTIASILQSSSYRFVVFADSDALWNHPEIPLESLLNHWNVTTDTSLAVSMDPDWCIDSHNRPGLNTGFIVAQNNERTLEILNAWTECPEGGRWEKCAEYKNKKVFEQTAFNEFVRYTFTEKEDIKPLPCDETDGYPGSPDVCDGEIVRHFWREKDRIKGAVATPLFRMVDERLHDLRDFFVEHREELYVEA